MKWDNILKRRFGTPRDYDLEDIIAELEEWHFGVSQRKENQWVADELKVHIDRLKKL
jgi:hypothetical protein